MDLLQEYIGMLGKEDIRHFKTFLERTGEIKNRKDFELFDYILKKGEKYSEDYIFKKLYIHETEKNNYYRLKNRLINDISKSLLIQYFNENTTNELFNLINISFFAIQKQKHELALRILTKAEKKAQANGKLELLDIIFTQIIGLANEIISIPVDKYIEKRSKNLIELEKVRKIDDTLSIISHQLRISQNYSSESGDVIKLLEKHIKKFNNSEIEANNFELRIKIFEAVSKILLQKYDFKKLEDYLKITWKEFEQLGIFTKEKHNLKLQMLTYLCNALFKNGKYSESLEYAALLHKSMSEFDAFLSDKYLIFYYNILIINYSELDRKKAIDTLENIRDDKKITQSSFFYFILLNLALLYFKQKEHRTALKNLLKLYNNDVYNKSGNSLKLKIAVFELIIRIELADKEAFEYRYKQIIKEFETEIKDKSNANDSELIIILKNYSELGFTFSPELKKKALLLIEKTKKSTLNQDTQLTDYANWLQSKIDI